MLRDATIDQVHDDPFARHVVSENARVHSFIDALHRSDYAELGTILNASHESLAVDFLVSTPELDTLVGILRSEGAYGARLTGAGFGGCVVALADSTNAEGIAQRSAARYGAETRYTPMAFVTRACAGASQLELS